MTTTKPTRAQEARQFHIMRDDPSEVWPKGAWSLYRINGDEIASRVVRERVNPKGWYEGNVIARHSWPGHIGMFETLDEVMKAIEKNV